MPAAMAVFCADIRISDTGRQRPRGCRGSEFGDRRWGGNDAFYRNPSDVRRRVSNGPSHPVITGVENIGGTYMHIADFHYCFLFWNISDARGKCGFHVLDRGHLPPVLSPRRYRMKSFSAFAPPRSPHLSQVARLLPRPTFRGSRFCERYLEDGVRTFRNGNPFL